LKPAEQLIKKFKNKLLFTFSITVKYI